LFNGILTSEFFPNSWSTGVLIPVFKKGDQRDPNNYRGISLASCLAKLFTNIINNRLIEWSKAYDTITVAQFGFRNGLSTVDAIFALQTLILGKKCCTVRLWTVLQLSIVDRLNLWYKLSVIGIQGKLLSIIQSMSSNIRTCVSIDGFY
jgi:hypothetical protein